MLTVGRSIDRPTRVILVRHGRSTFNEQKRYQGSSDESVLTEIGQETSRQVGVFLRGLTIDAIYASPLKRVEQTVDALCSAMQGSAMHGSHSIPIYKTRLLREIDLPTWEGLRFQFVQEQFAETYRCWKQQPHKFHLSLDQPAPSGEPSLAPNSQGCRQIFPVLDLYVRAHQFWQTVLPQHLGQTLLVVSHGGTNHALLSTALGLTPAQHHTLQQSNCGVSELELPTAALEGAVLRSLNLTHPLGETLPKLKEGKQGLRLLLVPATADAELIQSLCERLKATLIHFCLSTHCNSVSELVQSLLHHHPTTVQLQTLHHDFANLWQQTLANRRTPTPDLITGLVVASPRSIQRLLAQAIGLNQEPWRLSIEPGTISVLHYPSIVQRPVLQTLNLGKTLLPDNTGCMSTDATHPFMNSYGLHYTHPSHV